MGTDLDDPSLAEEQEEEGGPTKSFLEHLEDLRWTLMKCAGVIAVGFLGCLFAAPLLVKVLIWPLENSGLHKAETHPRVTLLVGTNRLGTFNLETNRANVFGTNQHTILEMVPVESGTNMILAVRVVTNEVAATSAERRVNLINLGPAAAFFVALKLAMYGGIALGLPFLMYFIGQFVFPALKKAEKKYIYSGIAIGTGLFLCGIVFCYFLLMPVSLRAAVQYSEWMGFDVNDWRAEEYISFVSKILLGMGLAFELPVVILVMVKLGFLNYKKLAGFRVYMIVVNLIIAGVLTPGPDIVTQLLMAFPLQFLYEVSVWIAWYWERNERKRDQSISV